MTVSCSDCRYEQPSLRDSRRRRDPAPFDETAVTPDLHLAHQAKLPLINSDRWLKTSDQTALSQYGIRSPPDRKNGGVESNRASEVPRTSWGRT